MTAVPVRLVRLHAASRRVPNCLLVLAFLGVVLRIVLRWTPTSGVYAVQIPLTVETAAAATVGLTTRSPFGEPERATGRWLPYLRLATVVALACAAFAVLAAGSVGGHLYGGSLGLLRNVAGLTGLALLTAAILGGSLSWTLPMGYLVLSTYAIAQNWVTPWVWAARPPHDRGAAVCAALTLAAGLAVTTIRGARDSASE
jgi:hypothetical protein